MDFLKSLFNDFNFEWWGGYWNILECVFLFLWVAPVCFFGLLWAVVFSAIMLKKICEVIIKLVDVFLETVERIREHIVTLLEKHEEKLAPIRRKRLLDKKNRETDKILRHLSEKKENTVEEIEAAAQEIRDIPRSNWDALPVKTREFYCNNARWKIEDLRTAAQARNAGGTPSP